MTNASSLTGETPRAKGDQAVGKLFIQALNQFAQASPTRDIRETVLENIPQTSTYGEWQTQHNAIIQSSAFKQWAEDNYFDLSKGITINSNDGTFTGFFTNGKTPDEYVRRTRFRTVDIHSFVGWPLLLTATKALAPETGRVTVGTGNTAKLQDIAGFYGVDLPNDDSLSPATRHSLYTSYANQLQTATFTPANASDPFKDDLSLQATQLADLNNRVAVSMALSEALPDIRKGVTDDFIAAIRNREKNIGADPHDVADESSRRRTEAALDTLAIKVDPQSSYALKHNLKADVSVPLRRVIEGQGLLPPNDYKEAEQFVSSLINPPATAPAHGNLGGAITAETQLSNDYQRQLYLVTRNALIPDSVNTLLEHLTRDMQWDPKAFNEDPRSLINEMLKSPLAQKLVHAAEKELGPITSANRVSEWVMAAIHTVLDKKSVFIDPPNSARTNVAGFDMASVRLSGKSASTIRTELSDELISQGLATPKTVDLATFILLSRKAPELLVKDIPERLTRESHSWVSFATAVARIETQAPGSTSNMTYAQVMARGNLAPITVADQWVEQHAQSQALKDWGVINGVLEVNDQDSYTVAQMNDLRAAFNKQVTELSKASKTYSTEMPDLHKRVIAYIKSRNPHLTEEQITRKSIDTRTGGFLAFPGPYSLVDLHLKDWNGRDQYDRRNFSSRDKDIDLDKVVVNTSRGMGIKDDFEEEVGRYFERFEDAASAQTKFLISTLSLEDRNIIEKGTLSVAKEITVKQGNFGGTEIDKVSPSSIILRSEVKDEEGNARQYTYEINGSTNTIRKRDDLNHKKPGPLPSEFSAGSRSTYLESVVPNGSYAEGLLDQTEYEISEGVPKSYFSDRSQYIADAMVKSVGVRDLYKQLKGTTTFDSEVSFLKKVGDFLLGLIPGYSAVANFIGGNWKEGVFDLAFDVLGFLVAGLGASAKVGKSLGAAASKSLITKAGIVGRAAVGALNPIDIKVLALAGVKEGIYGIGRPGFEVTKKPAFSAFNFDVESTFRNVDYATLGKIDNDGEKQKVAAMQINGNWYALSPLTHKPYGLPLKDFAPSS
ncbi:hypothetical protein [Pseudomonas sp. NS1(2017)]|uniref:hypothetical protein n=1 Tax=Pseudomonas sp. NS1(2017) TaxID=2025658 RepID=UPI0012FD57CE|nr:hypothetical protein [Pseudomonas sp. NS1(2017)]